MKDKVAYAIAAAVELKTGLHINLQSDGKLWSWYVEDARLSIMRDSDRSPQLVAQNLVDIAKPYIPTYKIRKRRDNDD